MAKTGISVDLRNLQQLFFALYKGALEDKNQSQEGKLSVNYLEALLGVASSDLWLHNGKIMIHRHALVQQETISDLSKVQSINNNLVMFN